MRASVVDLMPDPLSPLFATFGLPEVNAGMDRLMTRLLNGRHKMQGYSLVTINGFGYMTISFTPRDWWLILKDAAGHAEADAHCHSLLAGHGASPVRAGGRAVVCSRCDTALAVRVVDGRTRVDASRGRSRHVAPQWLDGHVRRQRNAVHQGV